MLAIKLSRFGKKKQPFYRLIVTRKTSDPYDRYIENLGIYNPRTTPKTIEFKTERIAHWLSKGAQPSDTVHNLLVGEKLIDAPKRNMVAPSKLKKSEEKPAVALTEIAVASASAEQPASEIIENPIEIEKPTEEATAFVAEQPEKKE